MKKRYPFIILAALTLLIMGAFYTPIQESNAAENSPQNLATGNWNQAKQGYGLGQYVAGMVHELIAEELGLTPDELRAACLEGKTWEDLAVEKGMDIGELEKKIQETRKTHLEELVKDGKITETQKDYMLEKSFTNRAPGMRGKGQGLMGGNCRGNGYRW